MYGPYVGKRLRQNAAGKSVNPAARSDVLQRLRQYQEGSAQVGRDYFFKPGDIAPGDGKKRHDSRTMDNYGDAGKGRERLLEEILHVRGLRDVRWHGDGLSAC